MTISDIVILALIACIAVMGFIKGMKKSTSSFFKFALSITGAFLLTKLVAGILLDVNFIARYIAGSNSLFAFFRSLLPSQLDFISTASIKAQVDGVSSVQAVENVRVLLTDSGLSGFFMSFGFTLFRHALINPVYLNSSLPTATDIVAMELSYAFFCLIIFVVLFLVIRLFLALISKVFKSKTPGKKRFLLRIGAFFMGAAKGFCYTVLLLCLVSLVSIFSFMNIANDDINNSKIARPLLNVATSITSNTIESPETDSRYQKLINISGYNVNP